MALHKLTDKAVAAIKASGRHSDGGNLYLWVSPTGSKSWVFLWTPKGASRREMGMGSYPSVSLAKARALASMYRVDVAEGRDPISVRDQTPEPTFGDAADQFIETIASEWTNEKHGAQWRHSMKVRCAKIRPLRVSAITTDHILGVLRQSVVIGAGDAERKGEFWLLMPETAGRTRNRIERVLNFAKTKGWRAGENPAVWKGHMENLLPRPGKLVRGHHPAMPYEELPAFMGKLRQVEGLAARAAEITILAMARSGEVLGMRWSEVDFERKIWTVPAARMKMGKEHVVPLCDRALELLQALMEVKTSEFVFPGAPRKNKATSPLSSMAMLMLLRRMGHADITMHGFRSAARDWAGDTTPFPREIIEHALAHKAGNTVEIAYRRSTALAKRAELMKAWEAYCYPPTNSNVVSINQGGVAA